MTYEITQDWTASTWIYLEVPKQNLLYESNDPDEAVTLITEALAEDITVTLGSTTLAIDTGDILYTAGTDYDPDQLAFTFTGSVTESAGETLTISADITNAPVVQDLIDYCVFIIKSDNEGIVTAFTDLYSVEQATLPSTGLVTDTARSDSDDNSMDIDGTTDGIGVSGVTYTFTVTNNNPMPADVVMIITKPTAVTVDDIDAMVFTST